MKRIKFSVTIPPDLKEWLRSFAKKKKMSMSKMIELIIIKAVSERK